MLDRVVELAGSKPDPHPIGLLTTENRDTYAEVRRWTCLLLCGREHGVLTQRARTPDHVRW